LGVATIALTVLVLTLFSGAFLIRDIPLQRIAATGSAPAPSVSGRGRWAIPVVIACAVLAGVELSFSALLPAILDSSQEPLDAGVTFIVYSLAIIFVGPALGALNDKIGLTRLVALLACVNLVIMPLVAVMMLWEPQALIALVPLAAVVLGSPFVVLPLIVSRRRDPRSYAREFSRVLAGLTSGMALGVPLWGLAYDLTGDYAIAVILATPLGAGAFAILFALMRADAAASRHEERKREPPLAYSPLG
jgi:nitrate/nitrite transporter NarK